MSDSQPSEPGATKPTQHQQSTEVGSSKKEVSVSNTGQTSQSDNGVIPDQASDLLGDMKTALESLKPYFFTNSVFAFTEEHWEENTRNILKFLKQSNFNTNDISEDRFCTTIYNLLKSHADLTGRTYL